MSRFRTDWAAAKVIMLRRTEAAKPNAMSAQASMASTTLKPLIDWARGNAFNVTPMLNTMFNTLFNTLFNTMFNTLHFSRSRPRVERALARCLAATVWDRTLCQ